MKRRHGGETASGTSGTSGSAVAADAHPNGGGEPSKRGVEPGLHLVATPIGNAADITLRALEVLRRVDVIACEDTRFSSRLLGMHGVTTRRVAYHDHNADRMRPALIRRLRAGDRVALISDAGTPLVSDPGYKLVCDALAADIAVHVAPGPSAVLAALQLSGLPSDRFFFAGFLAPRQAARSKDLKALAAVPATLIFFESAPRLAASLADMAATLGDRPAAVARELTKLYEEVVRAPLSQLAARYAADGPPKGEIVIVVGPPLDAAPSEDELDRRLEAALDAASVRDAATAVAEALGLPRRTVYTRAVELARDRQ